MYPNGFNKSRGIKIDVETQDIRIGEFHKSSGRIFGVP